MEILCVGSLFLVFDLDSTDVFKKEKIVLEESNKDPKIKMTYKLVFKVDNRSGTKNFLRKVFLDINIVEVGIIEDRILIKIIIENGTV